jgi:hypothetical protein
MAYWRFSHVSLVISCSIGALCLRPAAASDTLKTVHFSIAFETSGPHAVLQTPDSNANGKPDYIDYIGAAAEEGLRWLVDTMGFPAPISASAGPLYPITVADLYTLNSADSDIDLLGNTWIDRSTFASHICIENDFITGANRDTAVDYFLSNGKAEALSCRIKYPEAVRRVVFHELFHTSQTQLLKRSPGPLTESGAVWFENWQQPYSGLSHTCTFIQCIERGIFYMESNYGNFPYLTYLASTAGVSKVKEWHAYRGDHPPAVPRDISQEGGVFADFLNASGLSLDEFYNGYTQRISRMLAGDTCAVFGRMSDVVAHLPFTTPRHTAKFDASGSMAIFLPPFATYILKIPVRGFSPSSEYFALKKTPASGIFLSIADRCSTAIAYRNPGKVSSSEIRPRAGDDYMELYLSTGLDSAAFELASVQTDSGTCLVEPVSVECSGELTSSTKAACAMDHELFTEWIPKDPAGAWVTFDLGSVKPVRRIAAYWGNGWNPNNVYPVTAYSMLISSDRNVWTTVLESSPENLKHFINIRQNARYVKILLASTALGAYSRLAEVEIRCANPSMHISGYSPAADRNAARFHEGGYSIYMLDGRLLAGYGKSHMDPTVNRRLPGGVYIMKPFGGKARSTQLVIRR